MKVITEFYLRERFRSGIPDSFPVLPGQIITPSALQYLGDKKVAVVRQGAVPSGRSTQVKGRLSENAAAKIPAQACGRTSGKSSGQLSRQSSGQPSSQSGNKARYTSAGDGGAFETKPEYMTQLHGNLLVPKDHPRIQLRGKLDSLQSLTLMLLYQAEQEERKGFSKDLAEILQWQREILKSEVIETPFECEKILDLTDAELRERSHNPKKYFEIGHILPGPGMDLMLLRLNRLRTEVREVELAAVQAFKGEYRVERVDIIQALNRMSSAVYIMMLKFKSGRYA